ncbi:MAG: hypothetical protein KGH49_01825, partial [Candidatus Micrarchaeota archaeon]|nr:hypothetical protein [Candidatus Micrarchaeota archaeon]
MQANKLQSAVEFVLTYSWAIVIAALVIAALYFFVFAPSTLTPNSCSFSSGPYCQDLILGSGASLSKLAMLLTNTNPYPIYKPHLTVNITGYPLIQGTCSPTLTNPGGAVICNATIIPPISQSALSAGKFIFTYTPCPGGNVITCANNQAQHFP